MVGGSPCAQHTRFRTPKGVHQQPGTCSRDAGAAAEGGSETRPRGARSALQTHVAALHDGWCCAASALQGSPPDEKYVANPPERVREDPFATDRLSPACPHEPDVLRS